MVASVLSVPAFAWDHAAPGHWRQRRWPDAWAPGLTLLEAAPGRLKRSDVLKVRGGQFAALAHNVVGELLPFVKVAHSGALDRGNMDEYVFSAVSRLNEAEALLCIEELHGTLSHVWPPFENADRRLCRCTTSHSFASEFNVVLGEGPRGQVKARTRAYIDRPGTKSTRAVRGSPMAFKPNYGRDRAERGRAARARTEEKQRRKDEKAAQRKAERAAAESPPEEQQG